jgi:hypothetical protein
MSLDDLEVIDAIGIDRNTGFIVLTIADSWDWSDVDRHLLALQAKLNKYFEFIEGGQVYEVYPDVYERSVVIDVVGRFSLSEAGRELLEKASRVCSELNAQVQFHFFSGSN